MEYANFLNKKTNAEQKSGFKPDSVAPFLFDFQRDIVNWACKKGRSAIFAACGLCLLYTSPSPRDRQRSRMPSSA